MGGLKRGVEGLFGGLGKVATAVNLPYQAARALGVSTGRLTKEPDVLAAELRRARVPYLVSDGLRGRGSRYQEPTSLLQPQSLLVLDRAHGCDGFEVAVER